MCAEKQPKSFTEATTATSDPPLSDLRIRGMLAMTGEPGTAFLKHLIQMV